MAKKQSRVATLSKPELDKSTVLGFAGKKGKTDKPGERARLTLTMDKDLHHRLKLHALENETTVTALLEQWSKEKLT